MRLLTLIASLLALVCWLCFLALGISYFEVAACALQNASSITAELLHKVALPSVMLCVSLGSLLLTSFRKAASKLVLSVALLNLACLPVYWVSFPGLVVDEPMLSICSR